MTTRDTYQQIEKQAWAQYPDELRKTSDSIKLMEGVNPQQAQRLLKQHPEILHIRKVIALQKRLVRR